VDIRQAFLKFMRKVPFYGLAIVCGDDPNVRAILPQMRKRVLTYGLGENNRLRARDIVAEGLEQRFVVERDGAPIGEARLSLVGRHNVVNSLAAVAVALELGVPEDVGLGALARFAGVGRRFELHPEVAGVLWVDDYAHHPTELAATLSAARRALAGRRLVVLFQPHRYTRTRALAREFAEVLAEVDLLFLADVYPGGEAPMPGVSSDLIADQIRLLWEGPLVRVSGEASAVEQVPPQLRPGDILLTLGAGSVTKWGTPILERWAERAGADTPWRSPLMRTER
jgi:UDP-N-acetylmuramate--alanine ligase